MWCCYWKRQRITKVMVYLNGHHGHVHVPDIMATHPIGVKTFKSQKCQTAGCAIGKIRGSSKSAGFILCGPWMFVWNVSVLIHVTFESEWKWWGTVWHCHPHSHIANISMFESHRQLAGFNSWPSSSEATVLTIVLPFHHKFLQIKISLLKLQI